MTDRDRFFDFCDLVVAMAGTTPVAYPGVHFTPPDAGTWMEVYRYGEDMRELGMSDGDNRTATGFYRIAACGRQGGGMGAVQTLAKTISSAFERGTEFGDAYVTLTPHPLTTILDGDAIKMPVTIRWRAVQ